ncbi:cation:proton antiporter [Bowdeniella massiliensis]|uniref:cation:proton antiporter domain-containing protein n=1 Tax=Bowdeniella massiliensis TaxID=2932264 RepID=UPI002028694B
MGHRQRFWRGSDGAARARAVVFFEQALYGRITIGVLIMQDIFAVIFISISHGTAPNPLIFGLSLLIPLLVIILRRFTRLGHGEMQALFGIFMALIPGYALFEYLGLSGSLGALIMGLVLASHPWANQLSDALFTLKELLLVAFFVNIGFAGLPTTNTLIGGLMLLLLLPIQGASYWLLLALTGMRHRTSLLTGALLTSYSEFALIVAALGVADGWLEPEWLVKLAVAVAGSFVIAAMLNPRNTSALSSFAARFPSRPPEKLNIHDRPIPFGDATALVLGMGRVGSVAYQQLEIEHGLNVLGVEHDPARVAALEKCGIDAIEGDATDTDFWDRVMRRAHGDQAPKIHGDGRGPLHRSSPGPARTPHRLASSASTTLPDVTLPLR